MSGLRVDVEGGIARLTLSRPEVHNAFDQALIAALHEALGDLARRDDLRAVVLAAEGRSFSAGADLNWMRAASQMTREENHADALALAAMLGRLDAMPLPTLALVQGATFGGGVGLVSCCDVAIAAERATFALSEVRLGLVPGAISPYVVAAIGARQARRYFTTGERFGAQVALRIGLVHEVVADEAALAEAGERLIGEWRLVGLVAGRPIDEALIDATAASIAGARASDEGREGVAAFLDKRPPSWRSE